MNENLFLISDFSELAEIISPLVNQIDAYRIPFLKLILAVATITMVWQLIRGKGSDAAITLLGRLVLISILLASHKKIFAGMFAITSDLGTIILPSHEYIEFLQITDLKIKTGFSLWNFIKSSIASIILIVITIFHVIALKLFEIYRVFKLLFLYVIAPITLIIGLLQERKENPINYYMSVFETCMWKPVAAIIFKLLMLLNGHFTELSFSTGTVDTNFSEINASVNFFTVVSFSAITIILTLKVPQLTHWIVTKSSNAADDVMQNSYRLMRDKTIMAASMSTIATQLGSGVKNKLSNVSQNLQGLNKNSNLSQFKKLANDPLKNSFGKKLQNTSYDGLNLDKYHKKINYKDVKTQIQKWTPSPYRKK